MKFFLKYSPFLLVVLLTVFAILPLFHAGFYPMHDDEQIARLYDLNQALMSGNIPPRIAPNLGFGYGYPFFNFYPSFAYYVGEAFHLLGFGYIVSTKLMLVTGFIFAALFMYLFTREFFGKVGGVVASVAYTYASYHAVDVYVRGAYAEFFAFVWLPLIFWATYRTKKDLKFRYVAIGALAVAGLILSHNLIALMSAPFIAAWLVYLLIKTNSKTKFITYTAAFFLLGFGLSAYFWLPAYLEKSFTLINILTTELANYSIHFVCVHQLWDSPWGYGGSIPGCYDGISFEIGKVQLLGSFLALAVATYFYASKKAAEKAQLVFVFTFSLLLSAFLMVKFAKPIWDVLPVLWYIQFPWRFLLISAFLSAFLCGSIFGFIHSNKIKLCLGIILVILLIFSTASRFTPERFFNATDNDYINTKKLRWYTSVLAYEYVPQGIATKKSKIGTTLINISEDEIATRSSSVISGQMNIGTLQDLPQYKKFQVNVSVPGTFQINTYAFPGWTVFVNRNKVSFSSGNKLKLIRINLSEGSFLVEAKFLDTKARTAGNISSILSIITLVMALVVAYKKHIL